MKALTPLSLTLGLVLLLVPAQSLQGQLGPAKEDRIIAEASAVFTEIMEIPAKRIPRRMLQDAAGVAIIPNVIKGGFVIGARFGTGVILIRDPKGGWHAPVFIKLTGGNIGWQAGVQSTDVILVFKTPQSVQGLLSGKLTLGADASVAAGPIGRQASAATDGQLSAEIFSYSRSRGLFLGVSLDGSVIQVDTMANAEYYRSPTPGAPVVVPEAAKQLVQQVVPYTETAVAQAPAQTVPAVPAVPASTQLAPVNPVLAQQYAKPETDHVRDELAKFAPELYEILDPSWQSYLALPAGVFQASGHPSLAALKTSLARFDTVRTDPKYAALAKQPKFQSTYGLLKHYIAELSDNSATMNLPLPPATPPSQ
ncbi:MAG: lipid-binding SYLF domain-containing protein [Mariniblastus sp.]|nr:lipid-binding SYLF domain-containing protein [Mariniblastus sp.]